MKLPRLAPLLVAAALLLGCDRAPWEATSNAPSSQALPPAAPVLPPGAASAQATSAHVALGVPVDADPADNFIIARSTYVVSYNPKRLGPNWAAWRLTAADFGGAGRHKGHFITDEPLPRAGTASRTPTTPTPGTTEATSSAARTGRPATRRTPRPSS